MSWVDVEDAVQRVIVRASGLDADKVTWSYQSVDEELQDHVVLNFGGARAVGIDRIKNAQDLTRPDGQEVGQQVVGIREVPLQITCFSSATNGESAARFLVEKIRTNLRLDTNIYELRKVLLSVFDSTRQAQWIPDIPYAKFRGRAILEVRCYVPTPTVIEYAGYIARITGTLSPSGATGTFSFDTNNAP